MIKKYPFIILLLSLSYISLSVNAQSGLAQLLQNPALKHASVGICVKDLTSGKIVASHNPQASLTPASVMKLITTATAIEKLGPNFKYSTTLALDAASTNTILILGSGDPTLGSKAINKLPTQFLSTWAQALIMQLSDKQPVNILAVDNLFGYSGVSNGWTWIDMGNYYASGSYGISIFDNLYHIYFNTSDNNKCPTILKIDPEIKGLSFVNYLKLNNTGQDNGYIYGSPFSYKRELRGNIPAGRSQFSIKGDIPDPGLLLAQSLANTLQQQGVTIANVSTIRNMFENNLCINPNNQLYKVGRVLHTHQSPSLKEILREINVESNNHYAEHVIRTIGRYENNDIYTDALEEGVKAIDNYWKSKNITTSSLFQYDGSGLAPQNATSAEFLCDVLLYMHNDSKYSKEFYNTLPIAGKEGTLKTFMSKTKYEGKIRAKSGSISGVHCYAGYIIDGEKKYAFSIMINRFTGSRLTVRKSIESFISSL